MKYLYLIIAVAALSGCETIPDIKVDPNQITLFGTIEEKRIEKDPELIQKAQAEYESNRIAKNTHYASQYGGGSFAGGAAAFIVISLLDLEFGDGPNLPVEPVSYFITADNGKRYHIISKYLGFKVGDCVKLFLSETPEIYPPRIAYGSRCRGKT